MGLAGPRLPESAREECCQGPCQFIFYARPEEGEFNSLPEAFHAGAGQKDYFEYTSSGDTVRELR